MQDDRPARSATRPKTARREPRACGSETIRRRDAPCTPRPALPDPPVCGNEFLVTVAAHAPDHHALVIEVVNGNNGPALPR